MSTGFWPRYLVSTTSFRPRINCSPWYRDGPLTTHMDTKNKLADEPTRFRDGGAFARQTSTPQMRRSHWIIFFAICLILGLLVFFTIIHVINTTPSKARLVHAPAPVETVPVRRQDLNEVIGGSGSIEQAQTVQLTGQVNAASASGPRQDRRHRQERRPSRPLGRPADLGDSGGQSRLRRFEQHQDQGRDPASRALHGVAKEKHGNAAGAGEKRNVARGC